ncbi:MAG TPA: RNA polymerase sigma factor RpoD, partial [Spirochaetales bacterium]|nr:RNA polymerase sigma factor RpoD [Spirochaetales bacterium]
MSDLQNEPAIIKLIEFAKGKKSITYDEVNDFLPDSIVNSDRIDEVIGILERHNVKLEEEDIDLEIEEEKPARSERKLVYGEKESSVDDPIRLYLREIGREKLLTAEQEVILSKRMEDGENIITRVIKTSGILLPEVFKLGVRINARVDPRELELSKKEISEYLAEKRRLIQYYRE